MKLGLLVFAIISTIFVMVGAQNDSNNPFAYEPALPVIFGVDFLGWGFDATYRDPFFCP